MITNPFARKPKKPPVDQALDAFKNSMCAVTPPSTRRRSATPPPTSPRRSPISAYRHRRGRKLPFIAAAVAAGLGIAYLVRSKVGGSVTTQYPQPEAPKEPEIVVSNGQPEPPLNPTPAEEAKEIRTATPESEAVVEEK